MQKALSIVSDWFVRSGRRIIDVFMVFLRHFNNVAT